MDADNQSTSTIRGDASGFRHLGITQDQAIEVNGDEWIVPEDVWTTARKAEGHAEQETGRAAAARAALTWANGRGDSGQAMSELAESFHVLVGVKGVRPWSPRELSAYYNDGLAGSAELHAALFILNVWNTTRVGNEDRPWPAFDLHAAYGVWDRHNRGAFAGWASAPWWP